MNYVDGLNVIKMFAVFFFYFLIDPLIQLSKKMIIQKRRLFQSIHPFFQLVLLSFRTCGIPQEPLRPIRSERCFLFVF